MKVIDVLNMALTFESGLADLYQTISETIVETNIEAMHFFMRLSEEEKVHAHTVESAIQDCDAEADVAELDHDRLKEMLSMIDDIHDDVKTARLKVADAFQILAHMETFAEERFYGAIPDNMPGVRLGTIDYLKKSCQGHAARIDSFFQRWRQEGA